jgi:hypothetical protein
MTDELDLEQTLLDKLKEKIGDEPIRALYIAAGAIIAILALFGVTDGSFIQALVAIAGLTGGGEVARQKVTPVKKERKRLHAAYVAGRDGRAKPSQ